MKSSLRIGVVALSGAAITLIAATIALGEAPGDRAQVDGATDGAPPSAYIRETPVPAPANLPDALLGRTYSVPRTVTRGVFTSVQVNVNAAGLNIVGDAGNETTIGVDRAHPNRMVIGWRQFNTVTSNFRQAGNAFTTDGGRTWTFPGVIEPGNFRSDPVVDTDAFGNFYYLSIPNINQQQIFQSQDGGMTWGPPTPAFGGDKEWMVIDKTACQLPTIHSIWSAFFGCCGNNILTRSVQGAPFSNPISVPFSPVFGTLALGSAGELYIGGNRTDGLGFPNQIVVVRSSNANNPAVSTTFDMATVVDLGGPAVINGAPNPAGLLGQTWVATDTSNGPNAGAVYLLSSINPPGPDPLDVMFSRSLDGGATWSAPVRVNDDSTNNGAWQWFGTMSVAPNGRIDVIWNDTRNDPNNILSEVHYSTSSDGGVTWSANVAMTPPFDSRVGFPQQNKIGDYYEMVSDDVGASLAYAATFNGEEDVYYLRIGGYDCNVNGVDDAQDIASGASLDVNGNGIPDECEASIPPITDCNSNGIPDSCEPDCNNNGVPDDCDIASGFSLDLNGNGIPDECEAPPCPADLNGDTVVGSGDLAILIGQWGTTNQSADLDGSGSVGAGDLATLLGVWGPCP